jgi:hypothetical protein
MSEIKASESPLALDRSAPTPTFAAVVDLRVGLNTSGSFGHSSAWPRSALLANEPETVLSVLEAAFEDNEAPAVAIDCRGSAISVVMRMPPRDAIVPEMQADVTPTGRPTVKKMSKTLRNELHSAAVMSHALVTAKESFAVAPSIDSIALIALMDNHATVQPIYAASFRRDQLEAVDWGEDAPTISARLGGWVKTKGQARELACLPLGDEPELRRVVSEVAKVIGLPVDPKATDSR